MKSEWPLLASAVLVIALLLVPALEKWEQRYWRQYAQNEQAVTDTPQATITHRQAHSASNAGDGAQKHDEPTWSWRRFLFEINIADALIAAFTIVLAVATIRLWEATNKLGERADEGMRNLERPFVHISLGTHNLRAVADASVTMADRFPSMFFRLTNHGKTPAYIEHVHRWIDVEVGEPRVLDGSRDDEMMRGIVLGTNAMSDPMVAEFVFTVVGDREKFARSEAPLIFHATIVYGDIWGRGYVENFRARYNVTRERFDMWRWEEPWQRGSNPWLAGAASMRDGQRTIRRG